MAEERELRYKKRRRLAGGIAPSRLHEQEIRYLERWVKDPGSVPPANSKPSPLPHEPAGYDRGDTVDIPLDSSRLREDARLV